MIKKIRANFGIDSAYVAVIMIGILLTRFSTIGQPLIERHDFRQTQTAYQTLTLARGQGSLFHPKLPIFGSPWEVPFEFPLFQLCASYIYRIFNLGIDESNRVTSLIFFVLCLIPLYLLSKRIMSRLATFGVLIFFSFSPFALQWSRASLIEYCALFFSLFFAVFLLKTWESPKLVNSLLALIFGIIAGAVKATTFAPMLLFAAILIVFYLETPKTFISKKLPIVLIGVPSLTALILARIWTNWADKIRKDNPASSWLSEEKLRPWTYGTLEQRKIATNWNIVLDRIDHLLLGHISAIAILAIAVLFPRIRTRILSTLGVALITVLIFFNLYVVHDYYLVAISALIVMSLGVCLDELSSFYSKKNLKFMITLLTCCLPLGLSLGLERGYWGSAFKNYPKQDSELKHLSSASQFVFSSFGGWNPVLLYYADRQGMMLDPRSTTLEYLKNLPDLNKYDFYYGPPDRQDVMQIRGWYLPIGVQTTRIDDQLSAFDRWGLTFGTAPIQKTDFNSRRTISCNSSESFSLSNFAPGTIISTTSDKSNSLQFASGLQQVPVGNQIRILNNFDKVKYGDITCTGDGSVVFSW